MQYDSATQHLLNGNCYHDKQQWHVFNRFDIAKATNQELIEMYGEACIWGWEPDCHHALNNKAIETREAIKAEILRRLGE